MDAVFSAIMCLIISISRLVICLLSKKEELIWLDDKIAWLHHNMAKKNNKSKNLNKLALKNAA